jgi:hypothetical protein
MKPKSLLLPAVAAWLFAYSPAQAGPSNPPGLENENHYMCYQLKETKKLCWGDAGAPGTCTVLKTGNKTCYGGTDDGNSCTAAIDCDTLVCQVDDCANPPCYNGFPKLVQRQLEDQFEDKLFDVKKPKELCLPANKNNEDPGAPALPEHLEAYQIKLAKKLADGSLIVPAQPKHTKSQMVMQDQFGSHVVETIKENRLFVPTTKSLTGPAGAPPTNIDHYKCYKAKVLKKRCVGGTNSTDTCKTTADCPGGTCDLTGFVKLLNQNVEDQFQDKDFDIIKLTQVCAPVDKKVCIGGADDRDPCLEDSDCDSNECGEGILDNNLHYTCYLAKTPKGGPLHLIEMGVRTNNQFGKGLFNTVKERELCLPALKNPAPSGCNNDCNTLITPGSSQLTFETTVATGNCGVVRNFRCSNDANAACVVNADCGVSNTCNEVIGLGLPRNLECGGLYTGGGGNSVPLPFPVPDMGLSSTLVTAYNSGTGELTLGPTTPAQAGARHCTSGRECSGNNAHCVLDSDCPATQTCDTLCNFGPTLPIPNAMSAPTSVCVVNDVDIDASGTAQCDGGDTLVTAPLRSNVHLTGDMFSMTTPPDIPGVQPCPLCDRFCVGGTNADFPCNANGDCNSNVCNTQTTCLGGPNDGLDCTPATSDSATLGDNQNAYPTSLDCPPEPSLSITDDIGGLPIAFSLTSGTLQRNGVDQPSQSRVFSGFCRDLLGEGSGCFEGDTGGTCPGGAQDKIGVPCDSDADCSSPYESCAQRTPGAFGPGQAPTQVNVFGQTDGGCLGDGDPHTADLVSIFDIPPTFNGTVDAAGDLPGPGAAMIRGVGQLQP